MSHRGDGGETSDTNTWGHSGMVLANTILPWWRIGLMGGETSDTNTWGHMGMVLAKTILPWWRIGLMGGGLVIYQYT